MNNFEELEGLNEKQVPEEVKTNIDGTKNALGVMGGIIELILPRIFHAFIGLFNGEVKDDNSK